MPPKPAWLLSGCVISPGRVLVNGGAQGQGFEIYSCAWRGAWTEGDTSSFPPPRARIRVAASLPKPAVMQNHSHINLISALWAWQWTGLLSLVLKLSSITEERPGEGTSPNLHHLLGSGRQQSAGPVQFLPPLTFPPRPGSIRHYTPPSPSPPLPSPP